MMQARRWMTTLAAAAMLAGAEMSVAQIGGAKVEADARVGNALREAGLKFETDKDGDYRLLFSFDDKRSQLVIVRSKTSRWGTMDIREVYALGYRGKDRLTQDTLEKLLKDNAEKKSGAWELYEGKNVQMAVFSVKVAADCDPDALKTVIRGVAIAADEMEKALTGTDDL